jgi:hypothetical protein
VRAVTTRGYRAGDTHGTAIYLPGIGYVVPNVPTGDGGGLAVPSCAGSTFC